MITKSIRTAISTLMATALVITSLSTTQVAKAATSSIEVDGITYEYIGIEDGKYAENVVITSTDISISNIEVPEELDGYTVYSIGSPQQQFIKNDQFSTKNKSVSITIKAATEIYANAFKDVTRLKEITLPESLEIIEDNAFSNTALQEITLPESLETVGDGAFANINDLDVQLLNPNTVFTGFTTWDVNGIHSYENSSSSDFASISGDTFTTLNEYNETDEYVSSTLSLNPGSITTDVKNEETGEISEEENEINIEDVMQYNEAFPSLSTKVYLKPDYKVPSLKTLPTLEHYTFKGYAVNGILFYDEFGDPVVDNVDKYNKAFGDDYFVVNDGDVYTSEFVNDLSLTAIWEADTYDVVFDSNAEYALYEAPVGEMDPQTLTYNKYEALNKNQFSQTGYDFSGWNTRKSGYGDSFNDEEVVTNLIKKEWENGDSIILYAQWTPKTFNVTYEYPEKAEINTAAFKDSSYEFSPNGEIADIEIPTEGAIKLKGNTFNGWVDKDGNTVTEIKRNIPNDIVLTATFTPNTYKVFIDGEESTAFVFSDTNVFELPVPEEKTGYTFNGYTGSESVSEIDNKWVVAADVATDVAVETVWNENSYKIEYNLNGGTLDKEITPERKYSTAVSLPAVTKEGYTFEGWEDENGEKITEIAAYTARDVKIEAVFTKDETETSEPDISENPDSTVSPDGSAEPGSTTTPEATASAEASSAPSASSPAATSTPSTATSKKITVNIKNKKTYKKNKKVIIKAPNGIKTVKLNSKKLSAKKGKKKYTFKIKKFKKYLKKKGWNKLIITDKKNKKKTIKFKVK